MQPWSIVSAVVGIIALMLAIFIQFNNSINQKIDQKLNDPSFIKKVADEVRLPFVMFNDNESIIANTGAMNYIEDFKIKKDKNQNITEILVSPKSFMAIPPILESLDDKDIKFEEPIKGEKYDLIYKVVQYGGVGWGTVLAEGSKPQRRFRLQLVTLPEH